MNRLVPTTLVALVLTAGAAFAGPYMSNDDVQGRYISGPTALNTETIADRVSSGKMTVGGVENFIAGSGLAYSDVQALTLPEAASLVTSFIDGRNNS